MHPKKKRNGLKARPANPPIPRPLYPVAKPEIAVIMPERGHSTQNTAPKTLISGII